MNLNFIDKKADAVESFKIEVHLTPYVIECFFSNVFENDYCDWISSKRRVNPHLLMSNTATPRSFNLYGVTLDTLAILSDGYITIWDEEEEGMQINTMLTLSRLISGFEQFVKLRLDDRRSMSSLLEFDELGRLVPDMGNIDAADSDLILQFALWGECIYG